MKVSPSYETEPESAFYERAERMSDAPTKPGYYWAMSTFGLKWQMFVADYVVGTKQLVVRLAGAIHSRRPWFTPTPGDWISWQFVPEPESDRKWTYYGGRRSWPKGSA